MCDDTRSDTKISSATVLAFPSADCRRSAATGQAVENDDHGPSPEESLRAMRAFVGIKNKRLRDNLIEMLEGASQGRAPAARPVHE